jgi:hypothetical protein
MNIFPWKQLKRNRGTVFSVWSVPRYYNRDGLGQSVSCKSSSVGTEPPFREDLSPEALLEAVTGQLLMKTLCVGKDLSCALAICKAWKSEMALKLILITNCVLKWSINPIPNPKPRRESHSFTSHYFYLIFTGNL